MGIRRLQATHRRLPVRRSLQPQPGDVFKFDEDVVDATLLIRGYGANGHWRVLVTVNFWKTRTKEVFDMPVASLRWLLNRGEITYMKSVTSNAYRGDWRPQRKRNL